MVDGVLLVVYGGKTSRHMVKRSRQLLSDVGAKIFGVVLNNVNIQSQDYYYYQRYYGARKYKTDIDEDQVSLPPSSASGNGSGSPLGLG
jgi:Mrp family chromosome partitioning ATPase